jgi:WD40 repeat protein
MRWFEVVSLAALLSGGPTLAGPPVKTEGRCGKLEVVASPSAAPATFTCREFSPGGALFALGSTDGVVRVFDAAKGSLVATLGEPAPRQPTPAPARRPTKCGASGPPAAGTTTVDASPKTTSPRRGATTVRFRPRRRCAR